MVNAIPIVSQHVLANLERPVPECRSLEVGKETGQEALGQMQLAKDPLPSLVLAWHTSGSSWALRRYWIRHLGRDSLSHNPITEIRDVTVSHTGHHYCIYRQNRSTAVVAEGHTQGTFSKVGIGSQLL